MIAALRGAVFESLNREEENIKMFRRLGGEAKGQGLKDFFTALVKDAEEDVHMLKRLDLHSIIKFGLAIKFESPKIDIDDKLIKSITNKASANECLKIALDQITADIEYYEHVANHSVFPETKKLFRIIADKELERKSRIRALIDMIA